MNIYGIASSPIKNESLSLSFTFNDAMKIPFNRLAECKLENSHVKFVAGRKL